ncbi:chromophore lyase CpcT/CpeT [Maribacter sp.]|nr:chromophore lyase CpcT/CpeT [Maribacter sp.]
MKKSKIFYVVAAVVFTGILAFGFAPIVKTEKHYVNQNIHRVLRSDSLKNDLRTLLNWFPGAYDNHQQVYAEAVAKVASEKRHRQTHHIFYEVQLAFIPGRTLYAQQSQHYDLDDLYRQRIYAFEIAENEQAIRLRIYTPKDPSKLKNGHLKPEVFSKLSLDDFYLKPGCDVFWKREGATFQGYLKENACNYYSDRFETQVYLNETLILREDALLLNDRATDREGKAVFGVHDKGPTINLKEQPCN